MRRIFPIFSPSRLMSDLGRKCVFIVEFNSQAAKNADELAGMNEKSPPPKEMLPTTKHLGGRLRIHRLRLGRILEDVAAASGLTPVGLHNLEMGKASSKSDNYERVAKALGVPYPVFIVEAFLQAHGVDEFFIAEFSGVFAMILLRCSASQAASHSDEASQQL